MRKQRLYGTRVVNSSRVVMTLTTVLAATLPAVSSAAAHRPVAGWKWSFTPYLSFAGTKGRVGAGNVVGDVDLTFGGILETLDIGLMGVFEGRRGRWLGHLDGFYIAISDEASIEPVPGLAATLGIDQKQVMLAPEVGYTALAWPTGAMDVAVGMRYWHVKTGLTTTLPSGSTRRSSSTDWADATVGASVRATPWAPRWRLVAHGDLGAGGSDFTWQALGGVVFDITRCCSIGALYRHLDVDYESSSLVNDVAMSGPAISFGFRF